MEEGPKPDVRSSVVAWVVDEGMLLVGGTSTVVESLVDTVLSRGVVVGGAINDCSCAFAPDKKRSKAVKTL